MQRTFTVWAAALGFLGVAFGAFGTHALGALLDAAGRRATYETAVQYQLVHAAALLGAAWAAGQWPGRWTRWAGWLLAAGVVLFSGSLYVLSIFNLSIMGAVAPLGGACFLAGWACLGAAAWQARKG
jgi:uncharacterized membrane protein YgdD (TMEM256/DUF423 family)